MPSIQPNRRRRSTDPELEKKIEEFSRGTSTAPEPARSEPATLTLAEQKPTGSKTAATVGFNFKMTTQDHQRLKALCAREERSIQYMLNKIVWPAVERLENEQK